MTTSTASNPIEDVSLPAPPESVSLRSWPLRDDPVQAWMTAALVVAVAALAGFAARSPAMGLVSLAALGLAFWRMWVPVAFEFGPRGIVQTVLARSRRISWNRVARWEASSRGVLVLRDADAAPITALRGLYIPWGEQRENVLAAVAFYAASRNR